MLISTHTAFGILLANNIENPIFGCLSGIFSHYILDIIPHEPEKELFYVPIDKSQRTEELNKKLKRRIFSSIFDMLFSVILVVLYYNSQNILNPNDIITKAIIICSSLAPDVLTIIAVFIPIKLLEKHQCFHYRIHKLIPLKMSYFTAYGYQIILSLILVFCI